MDTKQHEGSGHNILGCGGLEMWENATHAGLVRVLPIVQAHTHEDGCMRHGTGGVLETDQTTEYSDPRSAEDKKGRCDFDVTST